jgi:hypothetical protein
MKNIGEKQKYLIQKVKRYFRRLSDQNIDISKSSFCYIPSYGLNPGNTKLTSWINNKFFNLQNIKIILFHVLAISSYYNYEVFNGNQKNYKNLIISWGRRKDFKKGNFSDKLLNVSSKSNKNSIFFIIYLDQIKPSFIPKNVVLFCKNGEGRKIFYLLKVLFKSIFFYRFNLKKLTHYVSSQTIFAEKINEKIDSVVRNNNITKVILPYEGQPFQNYLISKLNKKIKTYGIIHSILPALPTNLIKRRGSPENIYVSGNEQKKILINLLGWNKNQVTVIRSLRFKKNVSKHISGSVFLPINLYNINNIISNFDDFLKTKNKVLLSKLKLRNHPAMKSSEPHNFLIKELKKLIKKNKFLKANNLKKDYCIFIGPTSSAIEFLEKNFLILHIPINPVLDIYDNKIFKSINTLKIKNFFIYRKVNKKNIVLFGKSNYNLNSLKII